MVWTVILLTGLPFAETADARTTAPPSPSPSPKATATGTCSGKAQKARGLNPTPETWCEPSPGTWAQDPASPAKNLQQPADKDGCGFLDVGCKTKKAVNGWLADMLNSAKRPVLEFVAATALGTPEIDSASMRRVREVWGVSQTIANTCFVLLVTVAGVLLMAGQCVPGELSPKELLPRLVLAFAAANLSLIVIGYGISVANALARCFLESGPEKITVHGLATTLDSGLLTNVTSGGAFMLLVGLVVIALAVCVAFIYVMRLAITMVLISAAPLALMFHALPMTDGLARLWWRGITGILAIQDCQSLVLVTAFHVLLTEPADGDGIVLGIPSKNDLLDLLLAIGLLMVLIRIPGWVARTVWRPAQPRLLGQLIKTFVLYRGIGALLGKAGKGAAARSVRRPPSRPGPTKPRRLDGGEPAQLIPPRNRDDSGPPSPPINLRKTPPNAQSSPDGPPSERGGDVRPERDRNGKQGRATQLALPVRIPGKPGAKRPVQLALPIHATRVPRPPTPPPPPVRPRVRSRQLMFPGMPKRPAPPRQLTLRLDPPKKPRRTR
ncbi:hypothetical protein [Actinomadura sp. NBRC 104425]|uniref:hypothetical protein n=1 Tax=Actinomadura sp. NBRC 104425 TaxID=3032204 RepID=UPI002556F75A|nr:hypothetical protein [Actinomadura sp. NBRC 104425]